MSRRNVSQSEHEINRETGFPENLVRDWDVLRQRPKISHSSRHNLKALLTWYFNTHDFSPSDYNRMLDDIYRMVRLEVRKAHAENRRNLYGEI